MPYVSYEKAIESFKTGLKECKTEEEALSLLDMLMQLAIAGPGFKFYQDCKKLIEEKFR